MQRMEKWRLLNRRDALGLIGVSAAVGVMAARRGADRLFAAPFQAASAPRKAAPIPRGAIIRTILKDVTPEALGTGAILFHEHMSLPRTFFERMRPPNAPRPTTPPPPFYLENVDLITEEVKASGKDGVGCIVDGGHRDMGTSYANLKTIAQRSGVHIVASGGYYLQTT